MIPSYREVCYGLYGAWRLLHFDPSGMNYFDKTPDGFWKSFYPAIFWLPVALFIILIRVPGLDISLHIILASALAEVSVLFAFPLILFGICNTIDRQNEFLGCVVALNWSKIIQVGLYLPVILLPPPDRSLGLTELVSLSIGIFLLVYEGYILHRSLNVTRLMASGLVAVDIAVTLAINAIITIS
jgi:hypothetical protein